MMSYMAIDDESTYRYMGLVEMRLLRLAYRAPEI